MNQQLQGSRALDNIAGIVVRFFVAAENVSSQITWIVARLKIQKFLWKIKPTMTQSFLVTLSSLASSKFVLHFKYGQIRRSLIKSLPYSQPREHLPGDGGRGRLSKIKRTMIHSRTHKFLLVFCHQLRELPT